MSLVFAPYPSNRDLLRDSTDPTKRLRFSLSGLTTGTTRTLTVPDQSGTLPLLERANVFTLGPQTFNSGGASNIAGIDKGAASQTAHLRQWQTSAGTVRALVDADGRIGTGVASLAGLGRLEIKTADSSEGGLILTPFANNTAAVLMVTNASQGSTLLTINAVGAVAQLANVGSIWNGGMSIKTSGVEIIDAGLTALSTTAKAYSAATVPLAVQGAASQSASMQRWNNSVGTQLAGFNAACTQLHMPTGFGIGEATTFGSFGTSVGYGAASGDQGTAVGRIATAGSYGVAIGTGCSSGPYSTAIGNTATTGSNQFAVALGYAATASAAGNIALGYVTASGAAEFAVNASVSAGTATLFRLYGVTATSEVRPVANAQTSFVDSTDATRTGRLTLSTYRVATAQEALRIDSASDQARVAIGGAVVSGQRVTMYAGVATDVVGVFKGAASHTGDLLQGQNSVGTVLGYVNKNFCAKFGLASSSDIPVTIVPSSGGDLMTAVGTDGTWQWQQGGAQSTLQVGSSTVPLYIGTGGGSTIAGSACHLTAAANNIVSIKYDSGSQLGFYGVTPVARPTAYTQTYATASRTHAALTSATLTDSTGGTANTTVQDVTAAHDQTILNNNFADLVAQNNALRVDLENTKQLVNSLIDDLQAVGLLQ